MFDNDAREEIIRLRKRLFGYENERCLNVIYYGSGLIKNPPVLRDMALDIHRLQDTIKELQRDIKKLKTKRNRK